MREGKGGVVEISLSLLRCFEKSFSLLVCITT